MKTSIPTAALLSENVYNVFVNIAYFFSWKKDIYKDNNKQREKSKYMNSVVIFPMIYILSLRLLLNMYVETYETLSQ